MTIDTATAYYAAGAGLGHLQRLKKVGAALNLPPSLSVFSNSRFINAGNEIPYAHQAIHQCFSLHRWVSLPEESDHKHAEFLECFEATIKKDNIKNLIIDTFPVGIKGELNGISKLYPKLNIIFIARLLKWHRYQPLVTKSNAFSQCFYIEDLQDDYLYYLKSCSHNIAALSLPTLTEAPSTIKHINAIEHTATLPQHYCAISHTGKPEELEALIRYAKSRLKLQRSTLPIVLLTPDTPSFLANYPEIITLNIYPALSVLKKADIVVSGAGFNTLHELNNFDKPHWVLPFERRYDDQFLRAKRLKNKKRTS